MPGTEITGVQQRHLEAKLRGESLAGAGVQGRGISWWAFRQRAETWMLPYCWKQCMNKILHNHSSSQISLTHRHCPQGLSPEITMSTWSVQQPRQPLGCCPGLHPSLCILLMLPKQGGCSREAVTQSFNLFLLGAGRLPQPPRPFPEGAFLGWHTGSDWYPAGKQGAKITSITGTC